MQRMKLDPLLNTLQKRTTLNLSQHKTQNCKALRRKCRAKVHNSGFGNDFLRYRHQTQARNEKNRQTGLTKKLKRDI